MKITVKDPKLALPKADLCILLLPEAKKQVLPKGLRLSASTLKGFGGDFRARRFGDATGGQRVLLVGLGKAAEVDGEKVRRAAALAAKAARAEKHASVALWVAPALEKGIDDAGLLGRSVAEGAILGSYAFQGIKSNDKPEPVKSLTLCAGGGAALRRGVQRGTALAEANSFARDLQETPGNLMRPRDMVAAGRKVAGRSQRIRFAAHDEAAMRRMKMGSLLSVSKGSQEPAYLIHLTYKPTGRSKGKIAFVGKGLTFDAGGISLKPAAKMHEMKYDMSGGAAVLGIFHALGDLDVPYEVHGIVPTSENLPDGKANKPGDVVKAMNGVGIEILNTDAEGRLILADALAYTCKKVKPDTIVDLATLTGAVVVALGHELTGAISPSDSLTRALVHAGEKTGERVWRLPLMDCHKEHVKGTVADLRNINAGQGAGSTAGAAFLASFVDVDDWAHLDIAGAAWGADDRDYVGGGVGTGVGVRLLMQYLEDR